MLIPHRKTAGITCLFGVALNTPTDLSGNLGSLTFVTAIRGPSMISTSRMMTAQFIIALAWITPASTMLGMMPINVWYR